MSINSKENLEKAFAAFGSARPSSIADIVSHIHKYSPVREWVTMESVPVKPRIVHRKDERNSTLIYLPICARIDGQLNTFGLVVWGWPGPRVLSMLNVPYPPTGGLSDFRFKEDDLVNTAYIQTIRQAGRDGTKYPATTANVERFIDIVLRTAVGDFIIEDAEVTRSTVRDAVSAELKLPSAARVVDLTGALPALMHRTEQEVRDAEDEQLVMRWKRLLAHDHASTFKIAIVGEFSRGKTTLINKLFGRDLLPTGDVPTTAALTRIVFGSDDAALLVSPKGERRQIRLDELTGLHADSLTAEEANSQLIVQLKDSWLEPNKKELIDTPGVGDLDEDRSNRAFQAIVAADATVVTISATMPVSMTERLFIEEHLLSQAVPRVAIVITRLDQVTEKDRLRVLKRVHQALSGMSDAIELWLPDDLGLGLDETVFTTIGVEQIKARMSEWAEDPTHSKRKQQQLAVRLRALLLDVVQLWTSRREVVHARMLAEDDEQWKQQMTEQREDLRRDRVGLLLADASEQASTESNGRLDTRKEEVLEELQYRLPGSPSGARWWNNDLPYLLKRALKNIGAQELQQTYQRWPKIVADIEGLKVEEKRTSVGFAPEPEDVIREVSSTTVEDDSTAAARVAGVGTGVALVGAAALVTGGVALPFIGLSMLGGKIAHSVVGKQAGKGQKEELAEELGEVVENAFNALKNDLAEHVAALVEQMERKIEEYWAQQDRVEASEVKRVEDEQSTAARLDTIDERLAALDRFLTTHGV